MTEYSFWQDALDTYQSLSEWMKLMWLVVPPLFVCALIALAIWHRAIRADLRFDGKRIYTIHRDKRDMFHIYRYGPKPIYEDTIFPIPLTDPPKKESRKPLAKTAKEAISRR